MCFAPSFLRSRGGAVTRITESSYCRHDRTHCHLRSYTLTEWMHTQLCNPNPHRPSAPKTGADGGLVADHVSKPCVTHICIIQHSAE